MRFALLILLFSTAAHAQSVLLPHKAVYALELDTSKPHEGLEGASGKMVIEFTGNKCEGFVTTTRTLLNMDNGSAENVVSDQRATNYESGDASLFQFSTKHLMDNVVVDDFSGKAERKNGVVTVRYSKPEKNDYVLAENALFPSQHSFEMFKAMKKGEKLFNSPLFDGSQDKGIYYSTLTIFNKPISTPIAEKTTHDALKGERTPVFITFTNSDKKEADAAVSFSMRYDFHMNGVATNLLIINPALTLKATLTNFELLAETKCDLK